MTLVKANALVLTFRRLVAVLYIGNKTTLPRLIHQLGELFAVGCQLPHQHLYRTLAELVWSRNPASNLLTSIVKISNRVLFK
jgi:hypothetical protein